MKHTPKITLLLALTTLILAGCSTTRRIPEGDILYTGTKKIVYDMPQEHKDGKKVKAELPSALRDDIQQAVFVAPNNYWAMFHWRYPFPLGLWAYNNWPNPPHGFRHWLYEKFARNPVLISDVRPEVRTKMVEEMLDNNGYFAGKASYELVQGKNKRKAEVRYTVTPGNPYHISSVEMPKDTTEIAGLVDTLASKLSYLQPGNVYNADSLSAVRVAIANTLRNKGYYYFRPDFIEYLADSVRHHGEIALRMTLGTNLPPPAIEPYVIDDVNIYVSRPNGKSPKAPDTVYTDRGRIIRQMPSRLRPSVITDNIAFRSGQLFSARRMDRTQNYLSRVGIFSAVNINAIADSASSRRDSLGRRLLDIDVMCTLDRPLEASIEANVSSKSNSYLGPGLAFTVTNRNIFGGGEQLSVTLTGAYEWQTGGGNKGGIFNSYEFGLTGTLAFPRLLAPRFIPRRRRELNWTRFTLNGDMLNRPHYFKMAQFNMSMSYEWNATRHASMSFTPFKLTYTKLMHTTHAFDSIMNANPAVALSFRSQFIPQMQYTYNYDRQFGQNNRFNFTATATQAGNLFWCIYEMCGKHGEKKLFGTPFSQFVKGWVQLVYGRRVTAGDHWLVMRVATGAEHAYGNAKEVPYAEQFYCGGANSVRAFTVRSLGPGSYRAPKHDGAVDYFDQTGTFKFEANIEYRFPIVGPLHGAVFVDSGNVWLLKKDPARPGGLLRGSTFFKDLALGTGAGLRFDIGMLVLRGDLGIGIHAPYDTGKKGYYNMTSFGKSLAFHLAIGYPF